MTMVCFMYYAVVHVRRWVKAVQFAQVITQDRLCCSLDCISAMVTSERPMQKCVATTATM